MVYPGAPERGSYHAALLVEEIWVHWLRAERSFCYETVFSHPSKIALLQQAREQGYWVGLLFFHLSSSDLNKARVAQRVAAGGHDVPEEKIASRIPRSLANAASAAVLCHTVSVLDNTCEDAPFRPVLTASGGDVRAHMRPLPDWSRPFADALAGPGPAPLCDNGAAPRYGGAPQPPPQSTP